IVGAGHAGAQAAAFLRQRNFRGSIGLIGDEPHLPYERPPLSKDYLSRARSFDRMLFRPASFWDGQQIGLFMGQRATHVDAEQRSVLTDTGTHFRYERLIWAAGGTASRLHIEGGELRGIHVLRRRDDVDAIHRELPKVKHVVV